MSEQAKNVAFKKRLKKENAKRSRATERARLRELRELIRTRKRERSEGIRRARALCRTMRLKLKRLRKATLAKIRAERARLKIAYRVVAQRTARAQTKAATLCQRRTKAQSMHLDALAETHRLLAEQETLTRALQALDTRERHYRGRTTRAERASESDDMVRADLDAELVPVFNAVKHRIQARPGMSRTEAFLHWVEEHPDDVWQLRQAQADRELAELVREHNTLAYGGRGARAARRAAVPF